MIYYNLSINFIQLVLNLFLRLDKIYLRTDKTKIVCHYIAHDFCFRIAYSIVARPIILLPSKKVTIPLDNSILSSIKENTT